MYIGNATQGQLQETGMLKSMGDMPPFCTQCTSPHEALLCCPPKLLYNFRTAPCFFFSVLQEYDVLLKSTLNGIISIHFSEGDLVHCIIPSHLQGSPVPKIDDAKVLWSEGHDCTPPVKHHPRHQPWPSSCWIVHQIPEPVSACHIQPSPPHTITTTS